MRNNMNTPKKWIGSSCALFLIATGSLHASGHEDIHPDQVMADRSSVITPSQPVHVQRGIQAPLRLRMSYRLGHGVTNDYQKAVQRSQLAAQGVGHDPYNLKMSQVKGGVVTADYQSAVKGSRLAVIQGDGYKLGERYLGGDILPHEIQ